MKNVFLVGLLALCSVINLPAQFVGFSQFATGGTAVNQGTNWAVVPAEKAGQMVNLENIPVPPIPVLTFLSCRAFSLGAPLLQSYYSTNSTYFTAVGASGNLVTNFVPWPNGTNGLVIPQWGVISHGTTTNILSITNVMYGQTNIAVKTLVSPAPPDQIADEAVYLTAFNPGLYYTTNTLANYPSSGVTNSFITTNCAVTFAVAPLQTVNPGDQLFFETAGAAISIASQGTITATTFNSGAGILSGQRRKPFLLTLQSGSTAGTNTIDSINSNFVP